MEKIIKTSNKLALVFLFISLAGFIYNFIFYEKVRPGILMFEDVSHIIGRMEVYMGISFILIFFFHLIAIFAVTAQLRFFKQESIFRSTLFFVAVMSMLLVLADFALLSDIGKEYRAGLQTQGEWQILYASQIFHWAFMILMLVSIFLTSRRLKSTARKEAVLRDESIFINAQYIGIFCGISGLAIFLLLSVFLPLWALRKGIFTVSLVMVLPYLLIVAYWLVLRLKDKIGEWYDEKQYQDISRAGLTTLILSIFVMLVIFLVQFSNKNTDFIAITWFPFYLFIVLLIFSVSTLYYIKRSVR
ncbi:MAG: hypothetical protein ACQEP5_10230 [Actinomycetota bacterium]